MRYCVKINPVDLFDIPLFLSFLEEKLAIGLEAVKINRFYTIFKKQLPHPAHMLFPSKIVNNGKSILRKKIFVTDAMA